MIPLTNNERKPFASTKVGDDLTVSLLNVFYDKALLCKKECESLDEDEEGRKYCSEGTVFDMRNYQTWALVVEYLCELAPGAKDSVYLLEDKFKVIDNEGFIHEGHMLCEMMDYPLRFVEDGHTLFGGTRAYCVLFYPDFPKDMRVKSIVFDYYTSNGRIDLENTSFVATPAAEKETRRPAVVPPARDGGVAERLSLLERRVSLLEEQVRQLSAGRLASGAVPEMAPSPLSLAAPANKPASIKTVSELVALDDRAFRDIAVQVLQQQGYRDLEMHSDPEVGYSSMLASRYGTQYAVFAVPATKKMPQIEPNRIDWLLSFQHVHHAEKAILITSGKLSRDAESQARINNVEIIDKDRITFLLSLKDDTFGYRPL
jgi:hypothetical protein